MKEKYMFDKNKRTSSLKLSVPYEKHTTIRSDRFQTKDDVTARPDGIGSNSEGLIICKRPYKSYFKIQSVC